MPSLIKLAQHEGVRGMYRGLGAACCLQFCVTGTRFGIMSSRRTAERAGWRGSSCTVLALHCLSDRVATADITRPLVFFDSPTRVGISVQPFLRKITSQTGARVLLKLEHGSLVHYVVQIA